SIRARICGQRSSSSTSPCPGRPSACVLELSPWSSSTLSRDVTGELGLATVRSSSWQLTLRPSTVAVRRTHGASGHRTNPCGIFVASTIRAVRRMPPSGTDRGRLSPLTNFSSTTVGSKSARGIAGRASPSRPCCSALHAWSHDRWP
ncbi:unnamed protein product, partial [Ectocarpus sp. 8 AP-2014]